MSSFTRVAPKTSPATQHVILRTCFHGIPLPLICPAHPRPVSLPTSLAPSNPIIPSPMCPFKPCCFRVVVQSPLSLPSIGTWTLSQTADPEESKIDKAQPHLAHIPKVLQGQRFGNTAAALEGLTRHDRPPFHVVHYQKHLVSGGIVNNLLQ